MPDSETRAEVTARTVIEKLIRTAAELRREISPQGYPAPPYATYARVWDESRAAEVEAQRWLKEATA